MKRVLLVAIYLVALSYVALADHPCEYGEPNRDMLLSMPYGVMADPAAGMIINGIPVLQSDNYPDPQSLSDTEVWMLCGMQPTPGLAASPCRTALSPWVEMVVAKVFQFTLEYDYIPHDLGDLLDAMPIDNPDPNWVEERMQTLHNPFSGEYPLLQAYQVSPGDFFISILTDAEIAEYSDYNPGFGQQYYYGQRTTIGADFEEIETATGEVIGKPIRVRMYGENGPIYDRVYYKWQYDEPGKRDPRGHQL